MIISQQSMYQQSSIVKLEMGSSLTSIDGQTNNHGKIQTLGRYFSMPLHSEAELFVKLSPHHCMAYIVLYPSLVRIIENRFPMEIFVFPNSGVISKFISSSISTCLSFLNLNQAWLSFYSQLISSQFQIWELNCLAFFFPVILGIKLPGFFFPRFNLVQVSAFKFTCILN